MNYHKKQRTNDTTNDEHAGRSIRNGIWRVIAGLVMVTICSEYARSQQLVYVSLDGESRIVSYQLDDNGKLAKLRDTPTASPAGAMGISPDGKYLYVSLRQAGQLASYRRGPKNGELVHLNTVDAGADPAFVATDHSGTFLLTAYYVDAKVCVHRLAHGRISSSPIQTIATAKNAHAILPSNNNRFVLVPHTGPNAIYQFRFDERQGKLTANEPAIVKTGASTGPRQLAFHPTLNMVYFDYEQGSAIASYWLDRNTGTLQFHEQLSTIPESFDPMKNSNARIEMTRDGRYIYVANRGHDSLAGFAIDPSTGKLSSLGQFSTEPTPRGFAIDRTSRHLIAAGQASGKLALFRIDAATGALTRKDTQTVGDRPWWVLIAPP